MVKTLNCGDMVNEQELLDLERFLQQYDLSGWERDILIQFSKSKPIDELINNMREEDINDFLINLADGIKQYKHDLITKNLEDG